MGPGGEPTLEPAPTPETSEPNSFGPTTAPFAECRSKAPQLALLSAIQAVTPDAAADPNTPQGQATQWLTFDDPAAIDPCTYPSVEQRWALAVLYYATAGESWNNGEGWLSAEPECTWAGVTCNEDGMVTSLALCK